MQRLVTHLLVDLDHSDRVGARVGHDGGAEADKRVSSQLPEGVLLLRDLFLQEIVREKPVVPAQVFPRRACKTYATCEACFGRVHGKSGWRRTVMILARCAK